MDSQAKELISRAKTRLLSKHPFYGYLACRFKQRETEDMPTMATDMIHLFYNPSFVKSLTKTQLEAAIAHEVEHVYLKHPIRMLDVVKDWEKEFMVAQFAADCAINPHLKDGGFDLIEGAVFPEKAHWNESFEEHYKRLRKNAKTMKIPQLGGSGNGKGQGSCSGCKPMPGKDGKQPTAAEKAMAEAEIQTSIFNAASFARAAGKLPADIERMIQAMRTPQVAWYDVLRRFMSALSKNDYRMMPPNRRHIHAGNYFPSLRSETVGDVLLIIDGSGSTYHVFPQFISEFASILLDVRPEKLHVMVWDTRCSWRKEFDNYADESYQSLAAMQQEMGAGGGSVFTECFNHFENEVGIRPQVAIVLTDMEIYFPEDPGYPVMWIATTDAIGPFGETVKLDVDNGWD